MITKRVRRDARIKKDHHHHQHYTHIHTQTKKATNFALCTMRFSLTICTLLSSNHHVVRSKCTSLLLMLMLSHRLRAEYTVDLFAIFSVHT